jgi:hypothetical protein
MMVSGGQRPGLSAFQTLPIFFAAVLLLHSVEVVPEMIAAGPERDWRKLVLDLTFIRLPILVSGLFLVRDRH